MNEGTKQPGSNARSGAETGYAALAAKWWTEVDAIRRDRLNSPMWLNGASKANVAHERGSLERLKYCLACLNLEIEKAERENNRASDGAPVKQ